MLTQAMVKELFSYNPDTGVVIEKTRRRGCWKNIGDETGYAHVDGNTMYLRVRVNGKQYSLHRLIWLYMTGRLPNITDHIDGNGLNNKWENLRSTDHSGNGKNRMKNSNNTTGICGVTWHKKCKKYQAQAVVNKKTIYLGLFIDFFEACCARKSAELKYNFHPNHGKR